MATSDSQVPIPIPSFYTFFVDSLSISSDHLAPSRFKGYNFRRDFLQTLSDHTFVTSFDVQIVVIIGILWTIARYFAQLLILKPFALRLNVRQKDVSKFCESAWKSILYLCTWSYCVYILFGGNHTIFQDPVRIWHDWRKGMPIPDDIYALYAIEFGLYLHSMYATMFMDERRKDFIVMLFHHLLTLFLLGFSYVVRYHKIGVLVLFLHDVSDILLEMFKAVHSVVRRDEKTNKKYGILITVGFIGFTLSWIVFRLYWYPLKAIYAAIITVNTRPVVLFWFFIGMLSLLQLMHVYWFYYISKIIVSGLRGKEIDDSRETDDDDAHGVSNTATKEKDDVSDTKVKARSKKSR